jgi:hypothetical protein
MKPRRTKRNEGRGHMGPMVSALVASIDVDVREARRVKQWLDWFADPAFANVDDPELERRFAAYQWRLLHLAPYVEPFDGIEMTLAHARVFVRADIKAGRFVKVDMTTETGLDL